MSEQIQEQETDQAYWNLIIRPKAKLWDINLREIWQYRDLIQLMIRRNLVTSYKQTVLGYAWFVIQPVITVVMYMLVFGGIVRISTGTIPQPLFYLSGITLWQLFAVSFSAGANALVGNAGLFSKVYFPRLTSPISSIITELVPFAINLLLFALVYVYFWFQPDAVLQLNWGVALFPILVVVLSLLGLGIGLFFSSMTTKYRDLTILIGFMFRLWMYATPIIYPLSTIENPKLYFIMQLNPVTGIIEFFKWSFLGEGAHDWWMLPYSFVCMLVCLTIGIVVFNQAQRSFMDTV